MPDLPVQKVYDGFKKEGLQVMNDAHTLWQWLQSQSYTNTNVLLMSSGNYDGLDMLTFANEVTSKEKTK